MTTVSAKKALHILRLLLYCGQKKRTAFCAVIAIWLCSNCTAICWELAFVSIKRIFYTHIPLIFRFSHYEINLLIKLFLEKCTFLSNYSLKNVKLLAKNTLTHDYIIFFYKSTEKQRHIFYFFCIFIYQITSNFIFYWLYFLFLSIFLLFKKIPHYFTVNIFIILIVSEKCFPII